MNRRDTSMEEAKVKDVITDALQVHESEVKDIEPAGGMTNVNFKAKICDENFIVRLPGRGTDELIDRKTEVENLSFATELGINPEYIYFDTKNGIKITRKINGATPLTPTLAKKPHIQQAVIEIFHKLHQAEKPMKNDFKLFQLMEHYEKLVHDKDRPIWKGYQKIKPTLQKLIDAYLSDKSIKKAPCHIDPIYTNFILDDEETLFLIDWEYSGMFDPLWDVAAFSLESGLSAKEEEVFFTNYLERKPTEKDWSYLLLHKIYQDYLWSLWTFYKESLGSDFGTYGMMRLNRAKENISLYLEKYKAIYATSKE